jgi:LysW-gamma-L-lysine carboxypeptidase
VPSKERAGDHPLAIERDAVDLLESLVSISSPSCSEQQAVHTLVDWLEQHGWQAERDEVGNAVGVRGSGPREILLLGHIDTFPGEVPVRREGDRLFGRGTVDAKGPLTAFACAATMVEIPDGWRVTLVGAIEEESTTSRGARHILAARPAERAPRYCVIGEPSRWDRVTLGYKGRLHLHVTLRYPYSHSAGAGRLPAEAAVDVWRSIEHFCEERNRDRPDREFNRLTPSLQSIVTDQEGAFGTASLQVGFRLSLDDDPRTLEKSLAPALNEVVRDGPKGTELEWTFSGAEVAHKSSKANPLVRAFLRGVRNSGGSPRFVLKTGTSDMNVVAPGWPDTAIVAYGPGDSSLDHTPHEHLELVDLYRSIAVLQQALSDLLQG